ncbi:hypothetical protein AB0C77_16410, partial [Streptomyces sp. NPDC048629]
VRQFGISRVVVGEARTFHGGHDWLAEHGVRVAVLPQDLQARPSLAPSRARTCGCLSSSASLEQRRPTRERGATKVLRLLVVQPMNPR